MNAWSKSKLEMKGRSAEGTGRVAIVGLVDMPLRQVVVRDNRRLTDRSLSRLAEIEALESLTLWGTQLTDEAVASLAECRPLRTVYLIDTSVTSAGCSRLRELLPGCNVIFP